MTLSERDLQVIWHPYTQMKDAKLPIPIVKGSGAYLYHENGDRYIDAISSWWVTLHGHSNSYIAQKVSEQLNVLEHSIFAGFTHPNAVELAERLLKHLPDNQKRIFYSDNGSTAVEVALKMAFQYWYNQGISKTKIIAFKNAYHGDTFGAMSVSGRSAFTAPFLPFLFDVIYIDTPDLKNEKAYYAFLDSIKDEAAAIIFEPLVQGASGMLMYEADALDKLVKYCQKNKIITIADEVMTGFGRTGRFFATDYIQSNPDIFCLSKGITGGSMALGVTSCAAFIYDAFLSDDKLKTLFHGHSFTANPVACAASLASLDLMEQPAAFQNIKRIEKQHAEFFFKIAVHKGLLDVRQCGTILVFELKVEEDTSYFNDLRDKINSFFIANGILIRPLGNVFYILPPYCISNDDLQFIYLKIEEFLNIQYPN
jgi:adenosylmethionine-8-amino-7-oxononanoate aminotransferase